MTEEELVEVPEEEEDETPQGLGTIKVFAHTGPPEDVPLQYGDTISTIREKLRAMGRNFDGLACLLNGQLVISDNERYQEVSAGSNIVFSGSVKGGG